MPTNITQGNTAEFVIEFLDTSGDTAVPASGTLVISYINTSGTATSDSIALVLNGSFWTGSWNSAVSALGSASWSVSAPTVAATIGELRIIDP